MSLGLIRCLAVTRAIDVKSNMLITSPPKGAKEARGNVIPMVILVVSLAAAMFCAHVLTG